MFIITIDSGTTNTRVRAWDKNKKILSESASSVGVRDTAITGNNRKLTIEIKQLLDDVLRDANIRESDNYIIVASGMITSNVGLCEVPHLITPVGITDLANHIVKKVLPDISKLPIWFIPGVKNNVSKVTLADCEQIDIMRGEEVEVIGILSQMDVQGDALIILPGSHSKFVKIDQNQRISGCATTLSGELLDIITKQTILANSLEQQFASSIETEYLFCGANYCKQVGFSRACFSVRILDLFSHLNINQKANFLLGVVLYSDILTIKNSKALKLLADSQIIISGKKILCEAFSALLQSDNYFTGKITTFIEDNHAPLSSQGIIAVINKLNELQVS